MSVYGDSPTSKQFHVRFTLRGQDPRWSYVYDDEGSAREVLAAFEADPYRTDVGLWVRDVTPWRQVPVAPATARPHGHPIGEHCGICGSGVRG